jgi:hypothetical protein
MAAKNTCRLPMSSWLVVRCGTWGDPGRKATPSTPTPAALVTQRSTRTLTSYSTRKTPSTQSEPTRMLRIGV